MFEIIVEENMKASLFSSVQKKAVVIRHLYSEDGVNIPEDPSADVHEAFDVCDLNTADLKIPELQVPEINCEQQVRILDLFNRC